MPMCSTHPLHPHALLPIHHTHSTFSTPHFTPHFHTHSTQHSTLHSHPLLHPHFTHTYSMPTHSHTSHRIHTTLHTHTPIPTLPYPHSHTHTPHTLLTLISALGLMTEGCQAGDLVSLVGRAINHSLLREVCPEVRATESPFRRRRRETLCKMSTGSDDDLGEVSVTVRPSSLGLQKPHRPKELSLSVDDSSLRLGKKDSTATLSNASFVTLRPQLSGNGTLKSGESLELGLTLDDFKKGIKGFVPLSLRGLSLHSSGSVTFEHVGGLAEVKQMLKETLQWPHKVWEVQ